jgi:hypothetical protein
MFQYETDILNSHDLILLILKLAISRVVNRPQNAYIPPCFRFLAPPLTMTMAHLRVMLNMYWTTLTVAILRSAL